MDHVVTQSRVDGAPALLSMWPIALATADGRSATAWRPPALVRGSLCREASSPFHVVRQTYSYELLSSYSHSAGRTRRGVPFLTGQKEDRKSRPNRHALTALASPGCSSVFAFGSWTNPHPPTHPSPHTPNLIHTAVRDAAPRKARKKNPSKEGGTEARYVHTPSLHTSILHTSILPSDVPPPERSMRSSYPATPPSPRTNNHEPITTNQSPRTSDQ